ncbi:MAG: glycosyltransferase family 2 protein [Bacteroidetes bacterium]|nr:glycosyltransferase family 2 protein [Bacteroidota bacterium]
MTNYFLIPVFNEELNLPTLCSNLKSTLVGESNFYVFVDDGSSDNSVQIIRRELADKEFIILGDGTNNGPGFSFNIGFEWIIANSKSQDDIVITLEADNTSDIKLLPKMVVISKLGFDLVLASVYAQGGGFEKTSFFRKILSMIANFFFRSIFDVKVLTLSSFYRVYSSDILRTIKQSNGVIINEKGFICMLEILLKSVACNASIIEVPMKLHSSKRQGKSKMKILKTSMSYLKFLLKHKFVGNK